MHQMQQKILLLLKWVIFVSPLFPLNWKGIYVNNLTQCDKVKIYPKNLYEMQFLLLIVPYCAGGCIMDSTKGLLVYLSFWESDARLVVKKRWKPCTSHDCNHPMWDTKELMLHTRTWKRARRHICHVTATDILLHLLVQPALLYMVIVGVCLSQSSLAGDTYFQGH